MINKVKLKEIIIETITDILESRNKRVDEGGGRKLVTKLASKQLKPYVVATVAGSAAATGNKITKKARKKIEEPLKEPLKNPLKKVDESPIKIGAKKIGKNSYKIIRAIEDHPITSTGVVGGAALASNSIKNSRKKNSKKIETEGKAGAVKKVASGMGGYLKVATGGAAAGTANAIVADKVKKRKKKKKIEQGQIQEISPKAKQGIKMGAELGVKVGTITGLMKYLADRRKKIKDPELRRRQKETDDRRIEQLRARKRGTK